MERLPDLIAVLVAGLFVLAREYPVIWVIAAIFAIKFVIAKVKEGNAAAGGSKRETHGGKK